VHGGSSYVVPVVVTPQVLTSLASLIPLAPLHQPHNLAPIAALAALHPGLPQVACFDTSFHLTNARVARLYALPRRWSDEGILRFGFHGLSYEFIARELPKHEPRAMDRVIVAHLGNGASMCALVGGQSVASTMGFSALDGLPMGTRSGSIDPGVLLYLLKEKRMDVPDVEKMLYQESGLLGVSGVSSDMRTLLQSDDAHAREAVDLFVYRIGRELGSLAAAAGGVDSLVFTAGIGEHAAEIRARVCAQAGWLGIKLDQSANLGGGPRISTADSPVSIWALATDEESIIAMHARELTEHLSDT
jgi:acetate kinase